MTDIHSLSSYDYDLPPGLIATHPVSPRDAARLLVWPDKRNGIFVDLADEMQSGDVLVVNDSRVIPARLFGVRPKRPDTRDANATDVKVEFLLHKPRGDFTTWAAFAKPAKRLKEGDAVSFNEMPATVLGRDGDQVIIRFEALPDEVEAFLDREGHVPLPPYIDRADETSDKTEYQTVYAAANAAGSVAAPTAGLHFTDALLKKLRDKGVQIVSVTLHVGAGTFLPVTVDDVRTHKMHAEWGRVTQETADVIQVAQIAGKRIYAVGTTATRLLETAALAHGQIRGWEGETDIFIMPGFRFNVVDRLITNFHLPKSTLLMLVSAFLGSVDAAQELYAYAIAEKYRFYSYGDACLLTRPIDG